MVRMVGIDGPGAVQLLYQQHPGKCVRQGQVRQADTFMRSLAKSGVQAVGAANDQGYVITAELPVLELGRPAPAW